MFDVSEMAQELQEDTAWQETPYPVYIQDYEKYVKQSIKRFYVDCNHPNEYDKSLFIEENENNVVHIYYDHDFDIVQEEYIYILSKMNFVNKAFSDVVGSPAVSYVTNALSVSGAKEAYKSIQQQLDSLEIERIRVFHKMMANEES